MSSLPPLLLANWKMNLCVSESRSLARAIAKSVLNARKNKSTRANVQVVLVPSFTALDAVARVGSRSGAFSIGAQDCFWEERGAYTGEESVCSLREIGVSFVLIGHSERRQYVNESNEAIRKKIECVSNDSTMIPVLCIGENHSQKILGKRKSVLQQQLLSALKGLFQRRLTREIVIAYEPVWAIGTGVPATAVDCAEVYRYIRGLMENAWGAAAVGRLCRIIYGGSVSESTVTDFVSKDISDGALIGGASLTASGFTRIVHGVMDSL